MSDTDAATPTPAPAPEAKPAEDTFSRQYVEDLRAEAAKYRTEKKDAVEAAKAEVIQEYESKLSEKGTEFADLESKFLEASLELTKLKAVLEAEIEADDVLEVAALVQGSDEESISESVKRVKTLLGKTPKYAPAIDHTQGSGSVPALNDNALLEKLKLAVGA